MCNVEPEDRISVAEFSNRLLLNRRLLYIFVSSRMNGREFLALWMLKVKCTGWPKKV